MIVSLSQGLPVARAWELLVAMLVMGAALGIPGLIAAPIFYAYFNNELHEKEIV